MAISPRLGSKSGVWDGVLVRIGWVFGFGCSWLVLVGFLVGWFVGLLGWCQVIATFLEAPSFVGTDILDGLCVERLQKETAKLVALMMLLRKIPVVRCC